MPKPSRPAAWPHPYPKSCWLALMLAGTLRDQGVSAGMRVQRSQETRAGSLDLGTRIVAYKEPVHV